MGVYSNVNSIEMTYFIGVVYNPLAEQIKANDFLGGWTPIAPQAYCFSVQIPEGGELLQQQKTKGNNQVETLYVQKFKSVFFRPSSNLDISKADWEVCKKDAMVTYRLQCGALKVFEPTKEALEREPQSIGYRMYGESDALELVKSTKDLATLETWSSLEERKVVLEAIAQQGEAIESHLRKLREN
jgi:hypothetical protein